MVRRIPSAALIKLSLVALLLTLPGAALAGGQVGDLGFDFELTDRNGTVHHRSDYLGQVLYLVFMGYS